MNPWNIRPNGDRPRIGGLLSQKSQAVIIRVHNPPKFSIGGELETICHRAQVPGLIYNHRFSVLDLESCPPSMRWSGRKKEVFFAFFERWRSRSVFGNLLNKPVRDCTVFEFSRRIAPDSFTFNLPDPGLIRKYISFRLHRIFCYSNEIYFAIILNRKSRRDFVVNRDFTIRMFFTSDKNKTDKQK